MAEDDKARAPLTKLVYEQDWGRFGACVICGAPIDSTERRVSLNLHIEVPEEPRSDGGINMPVMHVEEAREVVICCAANSECYPKLEALLKLALSEPTDEVDDAL